MKASFYLSESERAHHRRRRFFLIYSLGALGLFLIGIVWAVRYAPMFDVKNIVIEGNTRVRRDEVIAALQKLVLETSFGRAVGMERIFAWPEGSARNLAFLPAVSGFVISKNFLDREVRVKVAEREAVGVWCLVRPQMHAESEQVSVNNGNFISADPRESATSCWWFDREGVLFARALDGEGGLLKTVHDYSGRSLGIGMPVLPEELMRNLLIIFEVLKGSGATAQEVKLGDVVNEEIEVAIYHGPRLYFSLRFPLGNAAQVVHQIFSGAGEFPSPQKLQYVDFRVEDRVYYK